VSNNTKSFPRQPLLQGQEGARPFRRRKWVRVLLRKGIAAAFAVLLDVHVVGRENLPAGGPLIVVGNHFNFLDPLAFIHTLPYPLEFIGGRQAPNAPGVLSWIRNLWGILPVSRGSSSRDALVRAQRILGANGVLGIFPEGGSWAAVLRPPRPGAALLAARSGAAILPIGLDGLVDVFPSIARLRRARVTVNIGKPFGPFTLDVRDRSNRAAIDEFGHEIMRHIAELIPPERRGFYSTDPAIREAARGTEVYPWDNIREE
jgi:1-acyl-sn-glycerol-3-phosphate acyltransferase